MARNNEPAFRRKTPLLICSIRTEIPYPCIGSSANVFRMSISSVPWTRSLGLSDIYLLPLGYQEEHTLLLLVVKRRRPENSKGKDLRIHGGGVGPMAATRHRVTTETL